MSDEHSTPENLPEQELDADDVEGVKGGMLLPKPGIIGHEGIKMPLPGIIGPELDRSLHIKY